MSSNEVNKKPILEYAMIVIVGAAAMAAAFSKLYPTNGEPLIENPAPVETAVAQTDLNIENSAITEEPATAPVDVELEKKAADYKIAIIDNSKLQWPTSGHLITQKYNVPEHTGLDIDGDFDSPVYAAESGVVEFAGVNDGGYGNTIIINHGNGMKTLYSHLSKFFVKLNSRVARGEAIGLVGETGWATGTHLHFEVLVNEERQDPEGFLRRD